LEIINNILDFSKIEAGKITLEERSFELRQCLEKVLDLFEAQIQEKELDMGYFIAPEVPTHLIGDVTRLRQILTNLMSNALKFTERGTIPLKVRGEKLEDTGCHLTFSVTDTGIGISRDGVKNLFQSFQQADSSTTRRYGGTGLGLAISKRLAELMGGMMWVESEPGAGSTFFFTVQMKESPRSEAVAEDASPALLLADPFLPMEETPLESLQPPEELPQGSDCPASDLPAGTAQSIDRSLTASGSLPLRILLAEDNKVNQKVLLFLLARLGYHADVVTNGCQALEAVSNTPYDLILMDVQMPEMDGIEATRKLRERL
jgi:CheY-like chemotaxis protein